MRHLARRPLRSLAPALAAVCFVAAFCPPARAGRGEPFYFPKAGTRVNPSGLIVGIDPQWVDAGGYRDVRIHISTANGATSPRDRTLRIELAPNHWPQGQRHFTVQQHVTLPQGATSTTTHILVPQSEPWEYLAVACYEGGYLLKELSGGRAMDGTGRSGGGWSEAIPAVLVIDAQAPSAESRVAQVESYNRNRRGFTPTTTLPDVRALSAIVRQRLSASGNLTARPNDMEIVQDVLDTPRLELLPPSDLPGAWIGYSCFDLIIISLADLAAMSQAQPAKFAAVIDWLSAGGNLLVYGVGEDYKQVGELEALCELRPLTKEGQFRTAGWKPASVSQYNNSAAQSYRALRDYDDYYYEEKTAEADPGERPPDISITFGQRGDASEKFLSRPCGMGMLIAMSSPEPFPASVTEWSWVFNTLDQQRTMWYRRHGLSLRRQNKDYWDFLVSGTGKAPVFEFIGLITLFCIFIGPVNYYILNRQRRLYLLLATIPAGAALVTLGLFTYALVTDGLGTQVRLRSYTHLDQQSGRATSWSRQSYYAGLAPSRGLTFPSAAAVYPIDETPSHEYQRRQKRRRLNWDEGQNLRSGYMASRVTSQFMVVQTAPSSRALTIDALTAPKVVHNRLGGHIEMLLVRDRAGDFYWTEGVDDDAKAKLEPADFEVRKKDISRVMYEHRPARPEGYDVNDYRYPYYYGYYNTMDRDLAEPHVGSSLMETRLRQIQNARESTFAPGTYVAIVATTPDVPIGVEGAYEHPDSLHMIEGKF